MSATFTKPPGMKYTTMCIYIDAHMKDVTVNGEHPEIEGLIYQYLYLIVYALSYKSGYFQKFDDYDAFSLYAASELYLSMRNKWIHNGEEVRGKTIVPVKSCLNFIKTVLFPLKVNYQRQAYATVFDPAVHGDMSELKESMQESVQTQYRRPLVDDYQDAIKKVPDYIRKNLMQTPFKTDDLMVHRLYISILLSLIDELTIPTKLKSKMATKEKIINNDIINTKKMGNAYRKNEHNVITWHLDPRYANYIKFFVQKAKHNFTEEFNDYRHETDLTEDMVQAVIDSAFSTFEDRDDYGDD